MKKIGILTFHRAFNPGAALQCYALQETLIKLGYDVQIINYKQPFVEYKNFDPSVLKEIFKHPRVVLGALRRWPINYFKTRKSLRNYQKFRDEYIHCSILVNNKSDIPQNYDRYLIGSDQVWGIKWTNGVDDIFWGEFNHPAGSKIVSYAISSNIESIDTVGTNKLKHYLNNFSLLSFREKTIRDYIYNLTGIKGRVDIDPVLLAEKSIWKKFDDTKKKNTRYIFVCLYRISKDIKKKMMVRIKDFAKSLNCSIVDSNCGPIDFLTNAKYAQYIISSSFHGTALSLVFEKPLFAVVLNDGYDGRIIDLLTQIDSRHALVNTNCDFTKECNKAQIDYSKVNSKLDEIRSGSLEYLKQL